MTHFAKWEKDGVTWSFSGLVGAAEISDIHQEFYSDYRCDTVKFQIFDLTELKTSVLNESDIRTAAVYDTGGSRVVKDLKIAFVLGDHSPVADVWHYVAESQKMNSTYTYAIFRSLESAIEWCRNA